MGVQLEPGLKLVAKQPECIKVTFFNANHDSFSSAKDERGQAFLFKRNNEPAVFIEVIHTYADKIRGNHVHQACAETLHVVSGKIDIFLLCEHGEHVYRHSIKSGEAIVTPAGTPHALYSLCDSECVVLFDKDPSKDRERVPILQFYH